MWWQVPTSDDIEEFVGADQWTTADFIWAGVTIVVTIILARVAKALVRRALRRFSEMSIANVKMVSRMVGWGITLIGVVVALTILGIDMGPAVILLLALAVVAFVAGRGLVGNFSAGLVLQGSPMFSPSDEIVTAEAAGRVREISGRSVVIVTIDGREVHIPNATVIAEAVTNLTALGARLSSLTVGVAYDTDLRLAKRTILEAVDGCDHAHADPEPEALITAFSDNSIDFEVRFWHDPTLLGELRAVDAVALAIADGFDEAGIEIPFPQRTLWQGDSADTSVGEVNHSSK